MGKAPPKNERRPAERLPIARVYVDVPLAHLDRTFDYQVPAHLDSDANDGCRVRVRFAGQLVDGYLVERAEESGHTGKLAYLERVLSPEAVLTPEIAALARAVADRYSGMMVDVLRLAIPPRHARVESEKRAGKDADPADDAAELPAVSPDAWRAYTHGPAFLTAVRNGATARAVWQACPGEDWPRRVAEAAAHAVAGGRGAVLVVPDYRDVARLAEACVAVCGEHEVVALSSGLGPAERYRRWLRVLRGQAHVVIGTRATMFAPVADPGLFMVWDDGDDLHAEPRSPYPHVRDVLIRRAHATGAALLIGGFARTAEAQLLVESGWANPIRAEREEVRARAPRITGLGEDFELARDAAANAARLPTLAFEVARQALAAGAPVLVQVPRRGYVPTLACGQCRSPARCRRCAGPLALPGAAPSGGDSSVARPPYCRWCGAPEAGFRCGSCGSARLRALVVGSRRTAEELGRAFAGVTVRTSGGEEVLASVPAKPALVVATPGAEPVAVDGYGAALLLDGWALLGRQDLRAGEEALRRWMAAAALVRPATEGGRVVVGADATLTTVQALVRWDPVWHAERELAERRSLGFPPAVRVASVQGTAEALNAFLLEFELPDGAEVLGPVPLERPGGEEELERALIRTPLAGGRALAAALSAAQGARAARKDPDQLRIRLDPLELI